MNYGLKCLYASLMCMVSSLAIAQEDIIFSTSTVTTFNIFLWLAVFAGVAMGFAIHKVMHKKRMAFDVIVPLIPAVIVAFIFVYIPYFLSANVDFGKICFQSITDQTGQIRESLNLAYECALYREAVSAWGISGFISVFKSAFGYTASDRYLSTATIYFIYYLLVALWVTAIYFLSLWAYKKATH